MEHLTSEIIRHKKRKEYPEYLLIFKEIVDQILSYYLSSHLAGKKRHPHVPRELHIPQPQKTSLPSQEKYRIIQIDNKNA